MAITPEEVERQHLAKFERSEARQKQLEELRGLCLDRALARDDPQAGMFAIACAILELSSEIPDIGEQLYQANEIARGRGDP